MVDDEPVSRPPWFWVRDRVREFVEFWRDPEHQRDLATLAGVVFSVCAILTWQVERDRYLSHLMFWAGASLAWAFRFNWPRWLLLVLIFVAPFGTARTQSYRMEWSSQDGKSHTTEWYNRATWRPFYEVFRNDVTLPVEDRTHVYETRGAISPETGNRHGKWEVYRSWRSPRTTTEYYWYGQKVSEGRWHELNR